MSLMNGEAGAIFTIMVACLALEAIMKDQVEQLNTIGVAATAMGRRTGSVNTVWDIRLYICRSVFGILTFCFAEFDTSVICCAVLMLCLGSFLLQNVFKVSKCWLSVRATKFEIFREHVSKKG